MHFYTVEVYQPFLERLLPGVSCEDLFKITVVSDSYDYDIEAHVAAQDIINEILTDDERKDIAIEYNEDFFPLSLCYDEEDLLEDDNEDTSSIEPIEMLSSNDTFDISFDGVPRVEQDITIHDLIEASYTLGDVEMEALQFRINIMVTPDTIEYINFETNTTVH